MVKRFDFNSFEELCNSALKPEPDNMSYEHIIGSAVLAGVLSIEEGYDIILQSGRNPGEIGSVIAEPTSDDAA